MNIVSNHNRLLRGAAIPTAGGDVYNSGWEYTPEGEISGYSGSAIYTGECECDSAAVVDSAFNKSTAWVDEQNYLTAHQDVTNLPYVQNSALEFSPQGLISGISGTGFYAASAEGALNAETANFAYNAEHADSADYANSAISSYSAQYAQSANSALNAEVANVSYFAISSMSAGLATEGWEYNEASAITGYNGSGFVAQSVGDYSGISPIVVDNAQRIISAESARLGVQEPRYFVEDSNSATVIGIYDSALSGRDWSDDITAASANALNEAINQITAVELANSALTAQTAINANHAASSDSATYDSLGRKIVDTYLTAHQQLPDWTPTIQNASGNAYNSAVNWVVDQHYLTGEVEYSAGDNIDITNHVVSGKDWSDDITAASANAVNEAINQITAVDYATSSNVANTALTANYVADGWEYNASNEITGYSGSAIHSESPSEGKIYTGISPIVVDNSTTTGTISAQTARLGVQGPLYFVEDTSASTVIGISGLPEVEGLMYESALGISDGYITGYNGSALSSERSRYAVSATSANGAVSSQTASVVTGGWETANGKITGYNGTAFYTAAGNTYDVKASSNISVSTAGNTFTVSGKDWTNTITAASSYAYNQATANANGKYIPYTYMSYGQSGTRVYNIMNSGLRVEADSGWTEMYCQNKENENEAHLQVAQNYDDGHSFWAELDGAGGGFLQMNWNSGTITPNSHSSYADGTCSSMVISNGAIVYASAESALGDNYDSHKLYQLGSERLRFWNKWGSASFGPRYLDVVNTAEGYYWSMFTADGATRFRIYGSAYEGVSGAVDLTPAYINFYDQSFNLRASLNYAEINALKALLNHVQSASANW